MQAIVSQAKATGQSKTAVVIEALNQAFGFPSKDISPASLEGLHQQLHALRQEVADLNEQLVELEPRVVMPESARDFATIEQTLADSQDLLDEVSLTLPHGAQAQEEQGTSRPTERTQLAHPGEASLEKEYGGSEIALQQLAIKVEQRARILEQVLSASVDHVCMYDRLGRYTYANRAFMQSLGLERADLYGKTWQQIGLPPETMKSFEAKRQVVFATGQSIAEEISFPTVNGVRDYEYILSPIRGSDGGIEAAVYTARDITERKQTEEFLRESEQNYRNLFESAYDSIFITDHSTSCLLDVNEHGARRLGYTRKQLLNLPPEEISPPMDPGHREEVLRRLWQTGSVTFEHVHRSRNGVLRPVEISSRVVEYGGQLAIQSFVRDITERKQVEERLELYREIITRFEEAIAIVDLRGYYIEQNPAHYSQLGYSDDELPGITRSYLLGEETAERVNRALKKSATYRGTVKSRTKSGDWVKLELVTYAIQNSEGQPICYIETKRQ
jgi:PAS domain S-box-containing protein